MAGMCLPCGSSVVITTPPSNCNDNCLYVPSLRWLCSDGPLPGANGNFDIEAECVSKRPSDGTFEYELYDFDGGGFETVDITAAGVVTFKMRNLYEPNQKEYRIRYKLKEVGGKNRSIVGSAYICMRNQCIGIPGVCDPLTGDNVNAYDINTNGQCGDTININIGAFTGTTTIETNSLPPCIINASIAAGVLSYEIDGCTVDSVATFQLRVSSGTAYQFVNINTTIDTKCGAVICPDGEECDGCTGLCVPEQTDILITTGDGGSDIKIN